MAGIIAVMSETNRSPRARQPCIEVLDDAMVEVLRAKTPAERVAMAFDAERTMRLMLEANLHWRHPEWNAEQITQEIARRRHVGSS
jgi:hypothetical protein